MGKKRHYAEFHARLHQDHVNEWCRAIVNAFMGQDCAGPGHRVVSVSARPGDFIEATEQWFEDRKLRLHECILVREPGDNRTSARELKRAWVRRYGADRIIFAIDDDPRNAAMYAEEGVVCLLAPGWKS